MSHWHLTIRFCGNFKLARPVHNLKFKFSALASASTCALACTPQFARSSEACPDTQPEAGSLSDCRCTPARCYCVEPWVFGQVVR